VQRAMRKRPVFWQGKDLTNNQIGVQHRWRSAKPESFLVERKWEDSDEDRSLSPRKHHKEGHALSIPVKDIPASAIGMRIIVERHSCV